MTDLSHLLGNNRVWTDEIFDRTGRDKLPRSGPRRRRSEYPYRVADIAPRIISSVGRYAITIQWSDRHSTGIYHFGRLREKVSP